MVTLSTAEAEYIAATEAVKEDLWIQGMLKELHMFTGVVIVYYDSQSAIHLCKNPVFHGRTKHVDIKYHFIRDKVAEGAINIAKVGTDENPADCGTKVVTLGKFRHCLKLLRVDNLE